MEYTYRPGEKHDSARIAELINIASGGVVEYLFRDLAPGMSPVQVVAHNLENDYYPHSYRSAVVAVEQNGVVGMVLSYPSSYHEMTDEMRSYFPADRLERLQDFFSSRVENTWYIDALSVFETHRRRGIGERLITLTREKALENGFNALSLIVFADNVSAITLYEHTGFEIVRKVKLQGNEFIKHEGGCLLMKCEIRAP